jgi:anti-anti-sigma factor
MEVRIREQDGITIASLVGKLDSSSAADVQDVLLKKITKGIKFVFDMESCTFVSSAGLRMLLIIAKRVKIDNISAAMAAVSGEIMEVMEMTGFDDMFDSYNTVDEAIKALQ